MIRCCLLLLTVICNITVFAKPVKIVFWHAMAGSLEQEVNRLAQDFNRSQPNYVIQPLYKGSYLETLTAFSAAFRAQVPPALVQVFDMGTSTMTHAPGLILPVGQLMQGTDWNEHTIWPALRTYYSVNDQLMAFPFNVSVPVMYYNIQRLEKLGYDAQHFPKTWQAFEVLLKQLKAQGDSCAYTSAYPSWIHVESFSALHGEDPHLQMTHLKRLMRWKQTNWFEYAGRTDEASVLFTSGKCSLFSQSSGAYQSLKSMSHFKVGIAALPIDHKQNHRYPNVVGGAALWVVAGQPKPVQKGIALFFKYLMQPEVQAGWYARTGYLPMLQTQHSEDQLIQLVQQEWAEPVQAGSMKHAQHRIRMINDEAIEAMFSNLLSPDEAGVQMTAGAAYASSRFGKNHSIS